MAGSNTEKHSIFETSISLGGVSFTEKALFAKHLSVMLKSGLTLIESLHIIEDGAQGKFKKVLRKIGESINSGHSLSSSMQMFPDVFSSLFVSATYSGESSGTLTENLEEVAAQLEKERELVSKIKSAMIYPIVILIAAFILGIFLAFVILPKIIPLFEGLNVDLPASTRALIWVAHTFEQYGVIIVIFIILFIAFLFWLLKKNFVKPITHKILLSVPVVKKIVANINLARFCRTLGTLLRSGLTIVEAMEVVRNSMNNYYFRKALGEAGRNMLKGNSLSSELRNKGALFPVIVTRMIQVGEESGNLSETLLYLADFYEVEVDATSKKLQTSIEPILLIVIGLIVGFMAISIITPIYDITGNIHR